MQPSIVVAVIAGIKAASTPAPTFNRLEWLKRAAGRIVRNSTSLHHCSNVNSQSIR